MARSKRRTKDQIAADQIIKARLNDLGETIYQEAQETSRYKTGQLHNSINYMVKPDTTLNLAQVYYGKFNYPKGQDGGEKNALLISVKKHVPATTKLIVQDINDTLLKPFKDNGK